MKCHRLDVTVLFILREDSYYTGILENRFCLGLCLLKQIHPGITGSIEAGAIDKLKPISSLYDRVIIIRDLIHEEFIELIESGSRDSLKVSRSPAGSRRGGRVSFELPDKTHLFAPDTGTGIS